jgi:hypothetical protein
VRGFLEEVLLKRFGMKWLQKLPLLAESWSEVAEAVEVDRVSEANMLSEVDMVSEASRTGGLGTVSEGGHTISFDIARTRTQD